MGHGVIIKNVPSLLGCLLSWWIGNYYSWNSRNDRLLSNYVITKLRFYRDITKSIYQIPDSYSYVSVILLLN